MPPNNSGHQGGMFHTFQGITQKNQSFNPGDGGKSNGNTNSKRITTPHACAECKRRKIRCDGQQPCGQCLSSRAPKRCFYDKHRQRVIPSRKTLEALTQQLEECRSMVKRLYPNDDILSLLPLSRQELLDLLERPVGSRLNTPGTLPSSPAYNSPKTQDLDSIHGSDLEGANIEAITRDVSWNEDHPCTNPLTAEADDNAAYHQASYLGASSIKAALTVMLKFHPALRDSLAAPLNSVEMTSNLPTIKQKATGPKNTSSIPWSKKGQTFIDAYFRRINIFIPMIDQASFRRDYCEGQRNDGPWLALLNMIFATGSIVATKATDFSHIDYYSRAMEHINIDAFGSSHIETVQALTIIGGYYLPYINRPNMANAVIGAAVRMASTLGLHKESLASREGPSSEVRRRTWWSLFCLDTWATTLTGRPSFGRYVPAINIRPPRLGANQMNDSAQLVGTVPFIENIKFCKIATRIQDMLAITPLIPATERRFMDTQLVDWYTNMPLFMRTTDPCAEPLHIARCIMKWRYQNLRMLIHRPVLLNMAINYGAEQDDEAVDTCREMARTTICDISQEWTRNQMSAWNAVWFLYQAAMIPLVSLFWEWDSPLVHEWQHEVQTILKLLDSMEEWSLAARRSREVVWRMYEASRLPRGDNTLRDMIKEVGFHGSPIGLEMDDAGHPGAWDVDGTFWGHQTQVSMSDEGIMAMDYAAMGHQGSIMNGSLWDH